MDLHDFFYREFIPPNTVANWFWFGGIILAGLIFRTLIAKGLTKIVFRLFGKKESDHSRHAGFGKLFKLVHKPWSLLLMLIVIRIACDQLTWPPEWHIKTSENFGLRMVLERALTFAFEFAFTWLMLRIADFFGLLLIERAEKTPGKADDQLAPFLRESIKVTIVIISVFCVLGSVFHINVASLIAGLGIGGIAVALAAKDSLQNLFASFTIFLDKPFTVDDFIQMGNITGTIEAIGFRSTRIRALDRSFITVPNSKMVENEVVNLSLRTARRVDITVGLTYDTTKDQLKQVIADIADYIEKDTKTSYGDNRVSLFNFGASSIDIQVIYYIPDIDYDLFLKLKEEINFAILEIVEKNGCSFAFPSQSVYIEKK